MKRLLRHPATERARRYVRLAVAAVAVLLAVAVVSVFAVDLGPALKPLAETYGSRFIKRPMHIGRLSVHLWRGSFVFEDFSIEGLKPEGTPFLTARRIALSMRWAPLLHQEVVFDDIDMTDWAMYTESFAGGAHNFPKFTPDGPPNPNRTWRVTMKWIRAHGGAFVYEDHGAPWRITAPNLEVIVSKPNLEYRGQAKFDGATVTIQQYEPMRAAMNAVFKLDGALAIFDRIDLTTDGSVSTMTGSADLGHFPEMTYQIESAIDFAPMRRIFFAKDRFELSGTGAFTGSWHLYKGGRDLAGVFSAPVLGVDDYRFTDVRGELLWMPDSFEVTKGRAGVYGGDGRFTYTMAPFGKPDRPAVATFDTTYTDVDLTAVTDFFRTRGLRLAGRASGHNVLSWPLGRFREATGRGAVTAEPAAGETLATPDLTPVDLDAAAERAAVEGPFSNHLPQAPVPIGGTVTYAFDPEWITVAPSHVATGTSYVSFEGRTAWGDRSTLPFHVTSRDWLESDRLLAGLLTLFGSPTTAIEIGGVGAFDGVMTGRFTAPRIEGDFTGAAMRAWRVEWGSARGHAVIENGYADVTGVVVESGASRVEAEGRFSLGYPRKDGGEQINARIRVSGAPLTRLRQAFTLYDYPVDGTLSGEFHLYGEYEHPYGFGSMTIEQGTAYDEPFDRATAALRFEGTGVRLDGLEIRKAQGRGVGAAFVGFDGTYSFNLNGQRLPVADVAVLQITGLPPLTGVLEFTAAGTGMFDVPTYDVKGSVSDVFLGEEGIGRVTADLGLRGDILNVKLEAASARLAVSGAGRVALTETMDADLAFQVTETSLDPYARALQPSLPVLTTAVATGTIRVRGPLADQTRLTVEGEVDRLDLSLFDYRLRNAAPFLVRLDGRTLSVAAMRLSGEGTALDVTGTIDLDTSNVQAKATGAANLSIIQGFAPDVRATGQAQLAADITGTVANPAVAGLMTITAGRIRHTAVPHALENLTGAVTFDSKGASLDGLRARLGGGDVLFGGRVDVEGYTPTGLDLTMSGRNMRLRFPEGMRSLVDATLSLTGTPEAAVLSGDVLVRSALYTARVDGGAGVLDLTGGDGQQVVFSGGRAADTVPLRYDVRISAPGTLRLENNLARIAATADLQLTGTYDRPVVLGRAQIDRGQVTFEGKRYLVTRGTIDFNDPLRIRPFLDVEAETRVRVPGQTYRVTVSAAGTLDRLTPTFAADPPLPEIETLSLILGNVSPIGRDVEFRQYNAAITPQEQLLRDRAARALTGVISDEVGRVAQQTLGVDTFQLNLSVNDLTQQSARFTPGARLTIGKRLSERIFLTFSRSLVTAARDQLILLEYDQSDRFSWVLSQNEDNTYALEMRRRHVF
ncbi:MAG: translocation/assembly module TamB domain-containing protein [Vicinamibacterales bacterium]